MKEYVFEKFTVKFRKFSEKDARIEKANQIVFIQLNDHQKDFVMWFLSHRSH